MTLKEHIKSKEFVSQDEVPEYIFEKVTETDIAFLINITTLFIHFLLLPFTMAIGTITVPIMLFTAFFMMKNMAFDGIDELPYQWHSIGVRNRVVKSKHKEINGEENCLICEDTADCGEKRVARKELVLAGLTLYTFEENSPTFNCRNCSPYMETNTHKDHNDHEHTTSDDIDLNLSQEMNQNTSQKTNINLNNVNGEINVSQSADGQKQEANININSKENFKEKEVEHN